MSLNQIQFDTQWASSIESSLITPALLFNEAGIRRNILRMIDLAQDPGRLMPHVKTHKCAEIVRMQMELGIRKFKCSTIAEAEMVGESEAQYALIAYPVVGPAAFRVIALIRQFPKTRFGILVDHSQTALELSHVFHNEGLSIDVWIDIDSGMGRTGIAAGDSAFDLFCELKALNGLHPVGLHHYDGHLHESDPEARLKASIQDFGPTRELADRIEKETGQSLRIVAGGSPTFPCHAKDSNVELSPGTTLLWDAGYTKAFPDLPFEIAALVGTRVVSHPGWDRICVDLGHKAIASESPPPRVCFPSAPNLREAIHSEEHLALVGPEADGLTPGDLLLGSPKHICPTVALYQEALTLLEDGTWDVWKILARNRRLTI